MSQRLKTHVVSVRLSNREYAVLSKRAWQCRFPMSPFLRSVCLGARPRKKKNTRDLALIGHLGKIASNLHQLERKAGPVGPESMGIIRRRLQSIFDIFHELEKRQPWYPAQKTPE